MHYTLCDMLADLTQNAVEAHASKITVEFIETAANISVSIKDNGKGMDEQTLKRVVDPFYTDGIKHPNRKVGLGIPFLMQTVEETGGSWDIQSKPNEGTTLSIRFNLENIDTPPIGDVPAFFRQIMLFANNSELQIVRKKTDVQQTVLLDYEVTRSELLDALGELETVQSLAMLGDYLSGLEEV